MMTRLVAWPFLVTLAGLMLVTAYWRFLQPVPTVTQRVAHWYDGKNAVRDQFRAGECATLRRHICISEDVWATSSRALVSVDNSIRVPLIQGGGPWSGCSDVVSSLIIPPALPVGRYRFEVKVLVETNPLRSDQIIVNSPYIDVVE